MDLHQKSKQVRYYVDRFWNNKNYWIGRDDVRQEVWLDYLKQKDEKYLSPYYIQKRTRKLYGKYSSGISGSYSTCFYVNKIRHLRAIGFSDEFIREKLKMSQKKFDILSHAPVIVPFGGAIDNNTTTTDDGFQELIEILDKKTQEIFIKIYKEKHNLSDAALELDMLLEQVYYLHSLGLQRLRDFLCVN